MTIDTRASDVGAVSTSINDNGKHLTKQEEESDENSTVPETRVYARRWLMLAIFIFYAIADIGHWLQYSIISNIITRYYGVSPGAVNWTSLVFLVIYAPTVFPASYMIDRFGLRFTAIVGCLLTTSGSWIKVFSASPDRFYVTFIGQAVISSAQVFVASVPGRLAANWFGSSQVSTATAIGLFGCQLAIATNFILPPNIVRNHDSLEEVGNDLFTLYLTSAIYATLVSIAVVAFFRSDPPVPPSETRRLQKLHKEESTEGFLTLTKRLLKNRSYLSLWHAFGVTIGVFNALGTLINQMYLIRFQNGEVEIGNIGVAMTVVGMAGSIVAGIVLDKTHKFKLTICVVCALSWIGHILLGVGLWVERKWIIYVGAIIFGFFNGAYSTIGFEVCAEFTYPDPEGVTTAYLTVAHQFYGAAMILMFGKVIDNHGDFWVHIGFAVIGFTGLLANIMTKDLQRRQNATEIARQLNLPSKNQTAHDPNLTN